MAVTAAELQVRFSSQGAAQVKSDIASVGDAVNGANQGITRATAGSAVAGLEMRRFGDDLLGFTKSMAESGATYQQEMEFINALAGGTQQTSQMLQDEALKLDRTTVFSAQDIAAGMEQLAREGFTPLQIAGTNSMNSLIQSTSNMAAALRINMSDAANMLGMTMRAYQIDMSQAAQTSDILTEAALRSGKSASEFNTQLQYVEATAHQLNIPLTDISAAVGELMSQNVPGAGQGLRAFLVGITSEGSTASKEMAKLGISAFDAKGNFIGLGPVIDEINTALSHLSPEEQSAAIKALSGGNRQVTALIQLLRDGSSGITEFESKMGTLGGAAHVMSTLMDNAAGSFKAFASSLETAKILMGESLAPMLKPVTDMLRELLGAFIQAPDILHAFAAAGIAVTGVLFSLAGALAIFKALDMGAALSGIIADLGAVALPLLALIALAGAFYLAWEHNFLGFRSLITGVTHDVGTFADAFKKAFSIDRLRTDPISATLQAISSGFAALNLQGISQWFDRLSVSSHALWLQLSAIGQQALPSLTAAWKELNLANDHFVTAVQDLLAGDLPGAMRQWHAALLEVRFAWDDVSTAIGTVAKAVSGFVTQGAAWVLNVGIPTVEGDATVIASTVWDWVQNTAWPAVQNAARTLGSLAVKIGGWLVDAAEDIGVAVGNWIAGHIGAAKSLAIDIGKIALSIAGWLVNAAEDIGVAVGNWIQSHIGAAKNLAIDVGKIALSIGGWIVNAAEDIAVSVGNWIQSHIGGVKSLAIDIGTVAVSIGGWLVDAADDIAVAVGNWIQTHLGSLKSLAQDIGTVAVKISDWLVQAGASLWDKVSNAVQVDWQSNSGAPIPLPTVDINVDKFKVHIDFPALNKALNTEWANESSVSPSTAADWKQKGQDYGKSFADNFWAGLWAGFAGGGGGGLGGAAQKISVITAFQSALGGFIQSSQDEAARLIKGKFASWHIDVPMPIINILSGKDAAALADPFQAIQTLMELQGLKLVNWFKNLHWSFSLPKISITPPSAPDLNLIPGIGPAFAQALGGFSTWVSGLKFSVDIPKPSFSSPSIGLPDFGGVMAGLAAGIGQVGAWFSGLKASFDFPKIDVNFGGLGSALDTIKGKVDQVTGALQTLWSWMQKVSGSGGGQGSTGNPGGNVGGGMSGGGVGAVGGGGTGLEVAQFGGAGAVAGAAIGAGIAGIVKPAADAAAAVAALGRSLTGLAAQTAPIAAMRAQVTSLAASLSASSHSAGQQLAAGLQSGMAQAVAAVANGSAAIRAAASLIGLSLAASGRAAGQQFAQGLGLGALQAAALMASAAGAILAVASMVAAQLGAAGTSGGLAFAVGIGMGALQAAADMAAAGAAIEGIANGIMSALAASGAAAGISFAAGIAAGMAVAEGAAAAGVGAIIAICSAVDLFGAGFATGASFGAGVAAGLASEEGAVAAEAAAIVASAAAASAAAAQIHSPSHLFRDKIGIPIAQGIAVGIQQGAGLVTDAAGSLISLPSLRGSYGVGAGGVSVGSSGAGGFAINGGINVYVTAGATTDPDQLAEKIGVEVMQAIARAASTHRRGLGVSA